MSPRQKSEDSKRQRLELRINDDELECIHKIQKSLGLTKSGAILYALSVLEIAGINREFREFVIALMGLKNIKENKISFEDIDEYNFKFDKQIKQVQFNFENFIASYKK